MKENSHKGNLFLMYIFYQLDAITGNDKGLSFERHIKGKIILVDLGTQTLYPLPVAAQTTHRVQLKTQYDKMNRHKHCVFALFVTLKCLKSFISDKMKS